MSGFRGKIDYLKLLGASLRSVEINGKAMNCIVIPVDYNDIFVSADKETGAPVAATQMLRFWEFSDNYRTKCMNNNASNPDYVAPTHKVVVSYGEEFQKKAMASAEKRVRANAEFMATNPSDEEIQKQAKIIVNDRSRIGDMTPLQPKSPQLYTGVAQVATGVGEYVAPDGEVNPEDDLPF
jgi:hypothetical protein